MRQIFNFQNIQNYHFSVITVCIVILIVDHFSLQRDLADLYIQDRNKPILNPDGSITIIGGKLAPQIKVSVSILCTGVIVGWLIGIALAASKATFKVITALFGVIFGGAPSMFINSMDATNAGYTIGISIGLLLVAFQPAWKNATRKGISTFEKCSTFIYMILIILTSLILMAIALIS